MMKQLIHLVPSVLLITTIMITNSFSQATVPIKSVEYECDSESLLSNAKSLFNDVLRESLEKLGNINPKVKNKLLERLQKRKLLIICAQDADFPSDMESMWATSEDRNFYPYMIMLRSNDVKNNYQALEIKHVLLHELLHYAEIDNLSKKKHNEVFQLGNATMDSVYSCTFTVYPASIFNMDIDQAIKTCKKVI